jgi:FtsZ-interacting cell division protein ZipA
MARFTGWRPTRAGIVLVVGIIVLAALVLGGLYLVRERGEQARRDEAIQVAEGQLNEEANDVALNDPEETNTPEETATPSEQTNGGTTQNNPAPTATELPQTGPSDIFAGLIVALLTFSVTSYVMSRTAVQKR